MECLVSSKVVRILNILEEAYFKGTITVETIEKMNQCSRNTVKADLEYLESNWGSLLDIEVCNQSISITNIAVGDLMMIKESLLTQEIVLELYMNIFFKPHYSIYDHSLDLNYSESHLRKTVGRINRFLKSIDAKIEYIKEGTESRPVIHSKDEIKLNNLTVSIYCMAPFKGYISEGECNSDPIYDFITYYNLPLTAPFKRYINIVSQVSETRIQQGFYTRDELCQSYNKVYEKYDIASIRGIFEECIKSELNGYFGEMYIQQHISDFKVVGDVLTCFMLKIMVSPSNLDNILNRNEVFYHRFKISHEDGASVMSNVLERYSNVINRSFYDYFGDIVYNLYIHLPNIRPYKSYRIGVYSDLGISHSYSIMNFVKRHFSVHQTEVYDENAIYDYIITTVINPEISNKEIQINISDLPGGDDLYKIYLAIYNGGQNFQSEEVLL